MKRQRPHVGPVFAAGVGGEQQIVGDDRHGDARQHGGGNGFAIEPLLQGGKAGHGLQPGFPRLQRDQLPVQPAGKHEGVALHAGRYPDDVGANAPAPHPRPLPACGEREQIEVFA